MAHVQQLIAQQLVTFEGRVKIQIDESIQRSHDDVGKSQVAQTEEIVGKARASILDVKAEVDAKFKTLDEFVTEKHGQIVKLLEQVKATENMMREADQRVEARDNQTREMTDAKIAEV